MIFLLALILSFVPMVIQTILLWWLDRYEKEPLLLLGFALLWGAIPSIILAIILEIILEVPILAFAASPVASELLSTAIAAPFVEEIVKALALLGLLIFFRREIDSPLDALLYGGMIGVGFAAVENFFYLLGAGDLAGVLVLGFLRAGLFGLNHAMFTGFTGLGIGLALETKQTWLKPLLPLLGLSLAIGAHAYHNTFATFWGLTENGGALLLALVGDWGGVLFLLLAVIWARFLERQRLLDFLDGAEGAQLVPIAERDVLLSPWKRSLTRVERLLSGGPGSWWQQGRYFAQVTEAAFNWNRAKRGDSKSEEKFVSIAQQIRRTRSKLT